MDKVKSYAVTFRPTYGVEDEHLRKFMKWVRHACDFYHVVTEKTMAERHIHAALFLSKEATRSNVVQRLCQLFPDLTTTEKRVFRNGIKIMYNKDWISKYLDKDDDTEVIASVLPEVGHMEKFFPPKPSPKVSHSKKCSLYYHELENLWMKHMPVDTEYNTMVVRDFLFKMMYSERCLPVIRDDKQIVQTARHFTRWMKRATESTIDLAPFEKEE